jgi:3'-5' exoribonuclease
VEILAIKSLKQAAVKTRVRAGVHAQIESLVKKETKEGKPFWELGVNDGEGKMTLRAWSDAPAFSLCAGLKQGAFLEVTGEFYTGSFGLESKDWSCRELSTEERAALLAGSPEDRARRAEDFAFMEQTVAAIADPRLRALCTLFFGEYGERFQRTAAARFNHHARRGGLVEHTAQMLRTALVIASVYPALNRDLLVAGVIFHDSGKLWENSLPADGFVMPYTERAELLGHIPIGIELVNSLWRKLQASDEAKTWANLTPETEQVRLHLLHLVASHHGELQFGSPVTPKIPEAWALHHIDNLDAKLEMLRAAYASAKTLGPRVFEKTWPLPGNLVEPLAVFTPAPESAT